MNKKLLIIIGIIILLIAGGTAFLLMEDKDEAPRQQSTSDPQTDKESAPAANDTTEQPATSKKPGQYIEGFDESILAQTEGTKIVYFHANWCPQCRALDADIQAKGVPAGVTIFKVNYDTEHDLRNKYGVNLQTTLVKIDDQGNFIEKYIAYDDPTLKAVKDNLLP